MADSSELFQLISTMDKPEKRFFKQLSHLHFGKEKNTITRLFDDIAMTEGNEKKLRKRIGNTSHEKHFHSARYKLQKRLLDVLVYFHSDADEFSFIKNDLQTAELLCKKEIGSLAYKYIKRALAAAAEKELFTLNMEALELERRYIVQFHPYEFNWQARKVEVTGLLVSRSEQYHEVTQLIHIADVLFNFYQQHGVLRTEAQRNEMEGIMGHALLTANMNELKSARAKMWYCYCWRTYGFLLQQNEITEKWALHYLEILESNPFLIRELLYRYLSSLFTLGNAYTDSLQFDKAWAVIAKINGCENMLGKNEVKKNRAEIFYNACKIEMAMYGYAYNLSQATIRTDEIIARCDGEFAYMDANYFMLLHFEAICIKCICGEWERALELSNKILNDSTINYRADVMAVLRVIILIIHYELKNYRLLPHLIRSIYRGLMKHEKLFLPEQALLKFFRNVGAHPSPAEVKLQMQKLYDELKDTYRFPGESLTLEYFYFMPWLKSKINRSSFAEEIHAQVSETHHVTIE